MNKRHLGRPKKEGPWPKCKVEECNSSTEGGGRGFCHPHYCSARKGILDWETGKQIRPFQRVRSYGAGARCAVEGCGNRPCGGGLCSGHWQQKKRGVELRLLNPRTKECPIVCLVPGCTKRAISKGMCSSHTEQRRRGLIDEKGNKLRDPYSVGHGRPRSLNKRSDKQGYILVWAPEGHPRAQASGMIYEHRLVMEQQLGRYLEEWELVHHKNGDRSDNRIENLELLDGRAKRRGPGHPPGHEFDQKAAIQVLLQQESLPSHLRGQLVEFSEKLQQQCV